ncbi:hypothetical protein V6N11_019961 [Hibiscus sabdariffa]|uniref:PB1 domain-containing protein n=1 Tax=Hibiscus sabdariffa TaxID=183260 RepID=A0ABR1ZZV4_9ROSI
MGKPTGKKKIQEAAQKVLEANKQNKSGGGGGGGGGDNRTSKGVDDDTTIFINMSQELKEEGNRLFQRRDHDGAMLKYEKALNLLPKNHIDVAYLRSNMAACYMQLGIGEYPRAIEECNLALEVSPKYSKALLKRARCYEALNRLDLAYADVYNVLTIEPNNLSALDIMDSVRKAMDEKGITVNENEFEPVGPWATRLRNVVKEKMKKKNKGKQVECNEKSDVKVEEEKKDEEKVIVEEKKVSVERVNDKEVVLKTIEVERKPVVAAKKKPVTKVVKLVLGDDIRLAKIPVNCNIKLVRDIAMDKFPGLKGILVKYRDSEGDLVTITNNDELRLAESSNNVAGATLRFYVVETNPEREPIYEGIGEEEVVNGEEKLGDVVVDNGNGGCGVGATKGICVEDWIVQFARLFKNYIGFDSDSYLDLHEIGMKLYAEAMEETVTSEDAQEIFEMAAGNFQEMAALALFNWGNVHMSRARKRVYTEDGSKSPKSAETTSGYEWTRKEYVLAAKRYEEALNIKPDFYEAFLALGQQQFEQAKHCWYHAAGSKLDLGAVATQEVLQLYNEAEDNMEKGMQLWEETKEKRLNGLSKFDKYKTHLQKMGLDGAFQDVPSEEATEQDTNMISQIYLLWGTLLYERSVVERKLELPTWEECLEVSIEKFELAGASPTDIAVLIKSHCSTTSEGMERYVRCEKVANRRSIVPAGTIVPSPQSESPVWLRASLSFLLTLYSFGAYDKCKCFGFGVATKIAMVVETAIVATKTLAWLLMMMGTLPIGIDVFNQEPEAYAGFLLARFMVMTKPGPENKDASDTEDDDDEDEDEPVDEQDEDAGEEEDESGEEGEEEGDPEDEPEANGDGGSGDEDEDEDEDGDDDDDDDDEEEEEEEEEDEEEEELQPPAKKRK